MATRFSLWAGGRAVGAAAGASALLRSHDAARADGGALSGATSPPSSPRGPFDAPELASIVAARRAQEVALRAYLEHEAAPQWAAATKAAASPWATFIDRRRLAAARAEIAERSDAIMCVPHLLVFPRGPRRAVFFSREARTRG